MIGTIANAGAILLGGTIGLLLRKGFPKRISETIMKGLGLCVLLIGITGAIKGEEILIVVVSMVLGAFLGELADLDGKLRKFGAFLEKKFKGSSEKESIAEGFVSASLIFCVGAMAIVGPLDAGLTGNPQMLYTKAVIDGIIAIVFASSLGIGVLLSAFLLLIYQGSITLLASVIAPFLKDDLIREVTCIGSLLIIAMGLNMMGITKLKVMNYLPGILIAAILCSVIK